MTGIIALDIDGTVTHGSNPIPNEVISYLENLASQGWVIAFITGRIFSGSIHLLQGCTFRSYLAVQNGAIILEMPSRRIISKRYLDRSVFAEMESICEDGPSDFVVYGGYEHNDICYFRPKKFSADLLPYLQSRITAFKETWRPIETFDEMKLESFPSIKCFGLYPEAKKLVEQIEANLNLHVPLIRDPFNKDYYIIQATHPQISKGNALQDLVKLLGISPGKLIAAGDDYNDCSMWDIADVRIVMETAPSELLKNAHVIAPSAEKQGIIQGIESAIARLQYA